MSPTSTVLAKAVVGMGGTVAFIKDSRSGEDGRVKSSTDATLGVMTLRGDAGFTMT